MLDRRLVIVGGYGKERDMDCIGEKCLFHLTRTADRKELCVTRTDGFNIEVSGDRLNSDGIYEYEMLGSTVRCVILPESFFNA